jgi:hypothetical protein
MAIVLGILGFLYLFFLIAGFSSDPRKKYYNRILVPRVFILHFSLALVYTTICWFIYHRLFMFSAPVFALASLFLLNRSVKKRYGRNIYLMIKADYLPANRFKGETLVAVAILLFSIFGPVLLEIICSINQGPIL